MAHPTDTRRRKGILWHKEDAKLTLTEARALVKHLSKTEEKRATKNKAKDGYEVWWAKK